MKRYLKSFGAAVLVFCVPSISEASYRVGAGIYDITGPASDTGLLGYAQMTQVASGIHTRLWSRSFVVENNSSMIVFSVLDLAFITHAIKQEIIQRLAVERGEDPSRPQTFRYDNVVLMATHTHSAPGGFSHHTLYNLPFPGFRKKNFEAIVSGTVQSILRAYRNREAAQIFWSTARLENANHNRSLTAFFKNPEASSKRDSTNRLMSQMEFRSLKGEALGILNFFSVHATTLPNSNKFLSSDNKGVAAILFDRKMNSQYSKEKTFVAAFANGDEGDASPNPIINGSMKREGKDPFEAMLISGKRQFDAAWKMFTQTKNKKEILGDLQTLHSFVELPKLKDPNNENLCEPAFGFSFAAGAEDGPGGYNIIEGITAGMSHGWTHLVGFLKLLTGGIVGGVSESVDYCHYPKPILLSTGRGFSKPWTPRVVPFQVLRVGSLVLLSVPGEMTTVAGERLVREVKKSLQGDGDFEVILAGLANDYVSYLTTPEEYQAQHYEGASTLFGPQTSPAITNLFSQMTEAMIRSQEFPTLEAPDFSKKVWSAYMITPPDIKALWDRWGKELKAPAREFHVGGSVSARFRAGNPIHDLKTMQGYFDVQRKIRTSKNETAWVTVATDADLETLYRWTRSRSIFCFGCSEATLTWTPHPKTPPGEYRFLLRHSVKKLFGSIKDYESHSSEFRLGDSEDPFL
jgi:neutral ceramidase